MAVVAVDGHWFGPGTLDEGHWTLVEREGLESALVVVSERWRAPVAVAGGWVLFSQPFSGTPP